MPSKTSRRLGLDHDFKRRISAVTSDWLSAQKPDSAHRVVCLGSLDVAVLRGIAPFLLATCMFLSSICARAADITVIDFESIADCQTVDFQFSPQFGIIFDYSWVARANADGFAHSGRAYLRACSCGSEFCGLPITIRFRSDQSRIKVWAGFDGNFLDPAQTVVMRAFDGATNLIGQTTIVLGPSGGSIPITRAMEIRANAIRSATIEFDNGGLGCCNDFLAVDDVEFEGAAPPPCSPAPVVALGSPADGAELNTSQVRVNGTVTGDNLSPVTILVTPLTTPPCLPLYPRAYSLPLSGVGTSRTFSGDVPLVWGLQEVRAKVTTTDCGYLGQAAVRVTNLPDPILTRQSTEGGPGVTGVLDCTFANSRCVIAVYRNLAISYRLPSAPPGPNTIVIRGGIFYKWREWFTKRYHEDIPDYCPSGEQVQTASSTYQDFGSGRIYTFGDSVFVPQQFVDAVRILGEDAGTWLPIGDPLECPGLNTRIFQQLRRTLVDTAPCTLEIKGDPPQLWVQRPGGDLLTITEAMQESQNELHQSFPVSARLPTIVERFSCVDANGPCFVNRSAEPPRLSYDQAKRFCYCTRGGLTGLCPATSFLVDFWEPVVGQFTLTKVEGILFWSHLANEDLASVHRCNYSVGGKVASDWNFHVVPLRPYKGLLAQNNSMEIEIESCDVYPFVNRDDRGQPGDLLIAMGRWIIDCGHTDYASEIHPPGILGNIHTEADPSFGQATVATLFVNGYYAGDYATIDLFPPPRPAPNAVMRLRYPKPSEAAAGVQVNWEIDPDWSSYVRVNFSAPLAFPSVNYGGRMDPLQDRRYYGPWTLGWTIDPRYRVSYYNY